MTNSFEIGQTVEISASFTAKDGSQVTPASVTLSIKEPDGNVVNVTPQYDGVSLYFHNYDITQSGKHCYKFFATGSDKSAHESFFFVTESNF